MNKIINKEQRIGEIATIFPGATNIFMDYEIDFCCGGDRPLSVAIEEKDLNEYELLDRLNSGYEKMKDELESSDNFKEKTMSEQIDYIVNKHHTFMKEEMPITQELLSKILKVHYVSHGTELSKLHRLFNNLKAEIEEHLIKEEELLFPMIKQYEKDPTEENRKKAFKVLEETESEHEAAGDILKEMRKITDGFKVPEDGCNTYRITFEKIEAIEKDLFEHIHLENNILFERLK
ncbi:iron-sulfur cluster repair di-iron protein [Senegalia massiliensis]|uniref:Iron-sulfur cluster repair di-iron protein n=1 Tax=Senegalia massiliensis TaxID=1720316 RepID=A0A845QUS0_9CLOT|nr:iron-sulfur cluster repair di-iron protein [Senegalia massiliensis]NBI05549.1 iron-sulfur cluster repair di-iron protein [Senegalia massiliensis]